MAIYYAGQPLLLEDLQAEAKQWLDRYLQFEEANLFGCEPTAFQDDRMGASGGIREFVGLPTPNYPDPPPLKINTIYWPTGATRWARGVFLATESTKNAIVESSQIRAVQAQPQGLAFSTSSIDNSVANSFTPGTLFTSMYLLPPRPVSEVDTLNPGTEQLWLIPLVDERYYWQFRHVGTFEPKTWAEAFTSIATSLGLTLANTPTPPSAYGKPSPAEHWRSYANAAYMLDAVAWCVGYRVSRTIDGSVLIQDAATATTTLTNNLSNENWAQVAGGAINSHLMATIPEKVVVTFRGACGDTISQAIEENATDHNWTGYVPGTSKVIHTNYPSGTDGVAALADQIAADFYAWHAYRYDRCFVGVKNWTTSGFDDYAEWSMRRRSDGTYEAQTRVQTFPYNFGTDENPAWNGCEEVGPGPFLGYLLEDLNAADMTKTAPATARAVRLAKNSLGNLVEKEIVTITNRSTSATAEAYTMVGWFCVNGENVPWWVDCLPDVSSTSSSC